MHNTLDVSANEQYTDEYDELLPLSLASLIVRIAGKDATWTHFFFIRAKFFDKNLSNEACMFGFENKPKKIQFEMLNIKYKIKYQICIGECDQYLMDKVFISLNKDPTVRLAGY